MERYQFVRWVESRQLTIFDIPPEEETYSLEEVGAKLGVFWRTVAKWVEAGRLKAASGSGPKDWRISKSELEALQNGGNNL